MAALAFSDTLSCMINFCLRRPFEFVDMSRDLALKIVYPLGLVDHHFKDLKILEPEFDRTRRASSFVSMTVLEIGTCMSSSERVSGTVTVS